MKPFSRLATMAVLLSSLGLSSCNVFDPFDSPTGDAQLLSAARACLDKGDLVCANDNYAKLSNEAADVKASESAFAKLDAAGIGMGVFTEALFADGSGTDFGKAVTKIANSLATNKTPGQDLRLEVFRAYKEGVTVQTTELRGFVKFVTSLALLSQLLAEDAGANKLLEAADLVTTPSTCRAATTGAGPGSCFLEAGCVGPAGTVFVNGTAIANLDAATEADLSGAPSFRMIEATVTKIQEAFTELQGTSGSLGGESTAFASGVLGQAIVGDARCFRYALLTQGIGN